MTLRMTMLWSVVLSGCAAETKPALQAAGALQTFATEADKLKQHRREVAKTRQQLVGEEEAQTALLSADSAQRLAVWSMVGTQGKPRGEAYARLLAATKSAADAWAAFEELRRQQAAALAAADTKVAIDMQKLSQVIRTLTTLGTPEGLTARVKRYVGFALTTREEIDKLNAKKAAQGVSDSSSERVALTAATTQEAQEGTEAPSLSPPQPAAPATPAKSAQHDGGGVK
jgi:hypothetical protein